MKKHNPHRGSDFDDFLKGEGIYEDVHAAAAMELIIEQIRAEMKRTKISKAQLAKRMGTSRSHVDRLFLRGQKSANLQTIAKAAGAVGKRLEMQLV